MKLLQLLTIALLLGCSNPSTETYGVVEEVAKVRINLVKVEFDHAVILENKRVTDEYFFFDAGYYDTIPVYVPDVDTLNIATIRDGEYCYNVVPVVKDSIYKLKAK